jgi:L-iditol 2-dehydrogenase
MADGGWQMADGKERLRPHIRRRALQRQGADSDSVNPQSAIRNMKVARLYEFNDIRIEDMPIPAVGPGEALVQTKACGICSGDVLPWYINKKAPLVLGHEPVGVIAEIGRDVDGFQVGDRVFVHHHAPCLVCRYCRRGSFSMCETWRRSHLVPGGIAEYFLVPEINLQRDTLKLPPTVSFDDGVLIEPTACVVKSFRRAGIQTGDVVLIIGLGVMGLLHVLLGREYGAGTVIGADLVSSRCEHGLRLGADYAVNVSRENLVDWVSMITEGIMADVVIVGPGSVEAMKAGVACAGKGSTVVLFAPAAPGEMLPVEPNKLYLNEISLVASYSCGPNDTREALALVQRGVVTADKVVTDRFTIEETGLAYRAMAELRDSIKAIITFP